MNIEKIIIRDAQIGDTNSLATLLEQLFSIEKDFIFNTEKQKRGLLMMMDGCGKHKSIKVAEYKTKIVGMCSIQTRISTASGNIAATVEDLVVDSNYRNMGIGKKLLLTIYSWSQKRGITNLHLLADKDNTHALDFYRMQNWKKSNLVCLLKQLK